jgi:hypothetical protein
VIENLVAINLKQLLLTIKIGFEWQPKMGFDRHLRNFDHWMAINCDDQKLMIENFNHQSYGDQSCFWPPYIIVINFFRALIFMNTINTSR